MHARPTSALRHWPLRGGHASRPGWHAAAGGRPRLAPGSPPRCAATPHAPPAHHPPAHHPPKWQVLGFRERWDAIEAALAKGENVVLLANHQTEADPGVFAHMLAASHPRLSTDVFYVAGDRVVSDPL